jgi:hypothetical protein
VNRIDKIINALPAHIWAGISVLCFGLGLILISQVVDFPEIHNDKRDGPSDVIIIEVPPQPTEEPTVSA